MAGLSQQTAPIEARTFEQLFRGAVAPDPLAIKQVLTALQNEGHSAPQLVFDVIPVVARNLGKAWERDEISFADVTIGCARLQHEAHELTDRLDEAAVRSMAHRKECLVLLPAGAQHTLGATILAQQLRYAGMRVTQDLKATPDAVRALAKSLVVDAVFLSASLSEPSGILQELVKAAKSQWPDSKVFLGGSIQDASSDITSSIGADCITRDWQKALQQCD